MLQDMETAIAVAFRTSNDAHFIPEGHRNNYLPGFKSTPCYPVYHDLGVPTFVSIVLDRARATTSYCCSERISQTAIYGTVVKQSRKRAACRREWIGWRGLGKDS